MTKSNEMENRELPDDWQWAQLGEVCEIKGGKRLPAGTDFAKVKTPYPYIRVLDFEAGTIRTDNLKYVEQNIHEQIARYIIKREDIYISIAGTIGVVGLVPLELDGAQLTENAARLVIRDKSNLDRNFLNFYLQSAEAQQSIERRTNKVGQPKLALTRIGTIKIPLPSFPEQRRIAAILADQAGVIARIRDAIKAQNQTTEKLTAAYLRDAFHSSRTQNWSKQTLGDVCEFLPAKSISNYGDVEVTAITTACLSETGFRPSGVKKARMWAHHAKECKVTAGEILIARSNTPELVGRVSMFSGIPEGAVASDLTIRLLPKAGINSAFLTGYLSSLYLSGYWKERAGGASGSMKKITRSQLQSEEVPIPSLEEQNCIAEILSERLATTERIKLANTAQLRMVEPLQSTLLRRAFNGEL